MKKTYLFNFLDVKKILSSYKNKELLINEVFLYIL
jgi:hypothetical protein